MILLSKIINEHEAIHIQQLGMYLKPSVNLLRLSLPSLEVSFKYNFIGEKVSEALI